ncbi:hypothetical protein ACFL35_20825 [Candidatus Riflebacteria bacterium]
MKFFLFTTLLIFFLIPGLTTAKDGKSSIMSQRSSYTLWLNQFNDAIKDYVRFPDSEKKEKVQRLIPAKPEDDHGAYHLLLTSFESYCYDFIRFEKDETRDAIGFYLQVRMKGIRSYYSIWLDKFKENLKGYASYPGEERKYVCSIYGQMRPLGTQADYSAWLREYNFWLDKYNKYNRPEYLQCAQWLEPLKPAQENEEDLDFLEKVDTIVNAICKKDYHMYRMNKMVKEYYYTLKFHANHGNEDAQNRLMELKKIFR